jgi:hypothetical protein
MSTVFLGIIAAALVFIAFRINIWLNDNPVIGN